MFFDLLVPSTGPYSQQRILYILFEAFERLCTQVNIVEEASYSPDMNLSIFETYLSQSKRSKRMRQVNSRPSLSRPTRGAFWTGSSFGDEMSVKFNPILFYEKIRCFFFRTIRYNRVFRCVSDDSINLGCCLKFFFKNHFDTKWIQNISYHELNLLKLFAYQSPSKIFIN